MLEISFMIGYAESKFLKVISATKLFLARPYSPSFLINQFSYLKKNNASFSRYLDFVFL